MARNGHCPIDYPVNCRALFYRDANRGDAVGLYQGLADVLEHGGVVTNDKYLVSWDGSRLLKDSARPRVEVELIAIGEPNVQDLAVADLYLQRRRVSPGQAH
jgi:hypothetical protein